VSGQGSGGRALSASAITFAVIVGVVVLFGLVTVDQAYRAINWTTVIQVGASAPAVSSMRKAIACSCSVSRTGHAPTASRASRCEVTRATPQQSPERRAHQKLQLDDLSLPGIELFQDLQGIV
jgi:hypothetical protein